ncbi:NB-ARC [Dillenia turbinata]|uniref:NB-ARC n=1 Tax=Dillenia turbinata TaxID=194707 RepID=A0AAN8VJ97_9MAGN
MWPAAAAQAIGTAVTPAADVLTCMFSYLKRKIDYVRNIKDNFNTFKAQAERLSALENDVKETIECNDVRKEPTYECKLWLHKVENKNKEIEQLNARYENSGRSFCGLCPFCSLLTLSKDLKGNANEIADLVDEKRTITILKDKKDEVQIRHAETIDYVPSLSKHLKQLLEFLKDKDVKRIGVYGMEGMGKTTVMENLNDELSNTKLFKPVIFITMKRDFTERDIQKEIVEKLTLDTGGSSSSEVIGCYISEYLKDKQYLLLLDDVISEIDLRRVGIHDNHRHGKLVLASRYKVVCTSMQVDEFIRIERLSYDDAKKLLRKIVGYGVFQDPIVRPQVERVLKRCGGVPRLIKAVGSLLKNETNEISWSNMADNLSPPTQVVLGDLDDLLNGIGVVYDRLDGQNQNCFLFGLSFPEEFEIYQDYLVECWKSEDLIGDSRLRRARDRGHDILKRLIDFCLMDACKDAKCVKMPKISRDMALRKRSPLYSKDDFSVKESEDHEGPLWKEDWKNVKVVSMVHCNVRQLPNRPKCQVISSLFLQENSDLESIPVSFFDHMSDLKVLDLHCTGIISLPSSISNLINLKGLYLNDCKDLHELPSAISDLKKLEVLDMQNTGIHTLPEQIGELTSLRCLRVSFTSAVGNHNHINCRAEKLIQPNGLSNLSLLEELTILVEPNDSRWNEIAHEVAGNLATLEHLTTLGIFFPHTNCLETFITNSKSWKNGSTSSRNNSVSFRSFKILVGYHETSHPYGFDTSVISIQAPERHLRVSAGEGNHNTVAEVLEQTRVFELIGRQKIVSLSDFSIEKMEGLRICVIAECNDLEKVVDPNKTTDVAFQCLEKLHLFKLQKLNSIWEGSLALECFAKLTILTLNYCPCITTILLWEIAKQLVVLQCLRVENCGQATQIIEANNQSGADEICTLPKLKTLELVSLPSLVSICQNQKLYPSLQRMEIRDCENLKILPLSASNKEELKVIKCNENWWRSLEDGEIKQHFESLCHFI